MPCYDAMVARVCGHIGHPPQRFRVFRLLMPYPVHGVQFVTAFDAPPAPAASP